MVLAGAAVLRLDGQGQVPPVRHWVFQGPPAGLLRTGGDERRSEVPDPQGRPVDGPPALGPHLLQPAGPPGLRDLRQAEDLPAEGHSRVLRGIRVRVKKYPLENYQSRNL